ncbi:MAG: IS3 family transposase [Balneolaceae bacterium]|nr:IS3 family transposase [Balneolaceae bacterium]
MGNSHSKKVRHQAIELLRRRYRVSMSRLAEWLGVSRAALYKSRNRFEAYKDLCRDVIDFVDAERAVNKKIGGVKLCRLFNTSGQHVSIGRDRFLTILREHGRLARKKRSRYTKSIGEHEQRMDLAYKLAVAGPGHLWVHDDTEVAIKSGKAHLALSTDAYSSMVMGYSWSRRAKTQHVKQALEMALQDHVPGELQLIHHSDNGSIYASKAYQRLLTDIEVSFSPPGRPDRNPIAEQASTQTFKEGCLCDAAGKTFDQMAEQLPLYIRHYNERRPHMSCNYATPAQVQAGQVQPVKRWKQRPKSYLPRKPSETEKNKIEPHKKKC